MGAIGVAGVGAIGVCVAGVGAIGVGVVEMVVIAGESFCDLGKDTSFNVKAFLNLLNPMPNSISRSSSKSINLSSDGSKLSA